MTKKMLIIAVVSLFSFLPVTNLVAADKSDQAGDSEVVEKQHAEQKAEKETLKAEHKTEKLEHKVKKEALKTEKPQQKAGKDQEE